MELQVAGCSVEVQKQTTTARASCVTRLGGSYYFIYLSFVPREDGTVREAVFSRRIETFCGKPVRSKFRHQLSDLADAASEAAISALS